MNITLEPKKLFYAQADARNFHAELVTKPIFHLSLETALAQQAIEQGGAIDPNSAVANHYRIQGAKDFCRILLNLVETPESPHTINPKELKRT
jgi:hypothetical protein